MVASQLLRFTGRLTPDLPVVRALGNRVLWPLHRAMGLGGGTVDVLGTRMVLDPRECVDRNLWFTPQLYDRQELRYLFHHFPVTGTFVDAGANVGFWSLRVASKFPQSRVLAIEANPDTAKLLRNNLAINSLRNVDLAELGLARYAGELTLYCRDHGNRGGDTFVKAAETAREVRVPVSPLLDVCLANEIRQIDFLKMDIEGMEIEVLSEFFSKAPQTLWPRLACVELLHAPGLLDLFLDRSYAVRIATRENAIVGRE